MVGDTPFLQLDPDAQNKFYDVIDKYNIDTQQFNRDADAFKTNSDKIVVAIGVPGGKKPTEKIIFKKDLEEFTKSVNRGGGGVTVIGPAPANQDIESVSFANLSDDQILAVEKYRASTQDRTISVNEEGELRSKDNTTLPVLAMTENNVPVWVKEPLSDADSNAPRGGPEKFLGFIPNPFHYSKEELDEIDRKRKIDESILDKYSINNDDFKIWLDRYGKDMSKFEYESTDFFNTDEDRNKLLEKLHYQQLMGYTASMGNQITSDLNVVKNQLEFETDPEARKKLLREQAQLEQALITNVGKRNELIKEFPQLMAEEKMRQALNAEYIEAVRNGSIAEPAFQVLKKNVNAGDKFVMDIFWVFS